MARTARPTTARAALSACLAWPMPREHAAVSVGFAQDCVRARVRRRRTAELRRRRRECRGARSELCESTNSLVASAAIADTRRRFAHLLARLMRASAVACTARHMHASAHPTTHTPDCDDGHRWQLDRRVGVQRLEVLVAVMLARERRSPARSMQRRSRRCHRGCSRWSRTLWRRSDMPTPPTSEELRVRGARASCH